MLNNQSENVDLVKELRLRRWARLNYIRPEQRNNRWSPIILDEMERKDLEIEIQDENRRPLSPYVPLVPSSNQMIHAPHDGPGSRPHVVTAVSREMAEVEYAQQ